MTSWETLSYHHVERGCNNTKWCWANYKPITIWRKPIIPWRKPVARWECRGLWRWLWDSSWTPSRSREPLEGGSLRSRRPPGTGSRTPAGHGPWTHRSRDRLDQGHSRRRGREPAQCLHVIQGESKNIQQWSTVSNVWAYRVVYTPFWLAVYIQQLTVFAVLHYLYSLSRFDNSQ